MRSVAVSLAVALLASGARADVIDPQSPPDPVLEQLTEAFDAAGIDVLYSHDSERGQVAPSFGDAPRVAPLLGFRAWPGVEVDLEQHAEWLDSFATGARGAIAAVNDGAGRSVDADEFAGVWRDAPREQRVVLTFDAADLDIARRVAATLVDNGYSVYLAIANPEQEKLDPATFGRLFVDAEHHIVLDTASARLNPIIQFEAELLAELRRQDEWLASDDGGLPPVKRGSMDVIESLGVLPMKVLPGGIALGKRAVYADGLGSGHVTIDGSDFALHLGDERFVLEQVSDETRDAIRAFVAIPDSHSVVDIAGGSVTLADPLHDTRIGSRMENADRMPFHHLSISGAQKSVIVDDGVRVRRDGDDVAVDVTLEVRFYRRDDDGHADRLATINFTIADATGRPGLLDLQWSRARDRKVGFDGSGIESMTGDLRALALDAALIALVRADAS